VATILSSKHDLTTKKIGKKTSTRSDTISPSVTTVSRWDLHPRDSDTISIQNMGKKMRPNAPGDV
jgi:hypothetical protein